MWLGVSGAALARSASQRHVRRSLQGGERERVSLCAEVGVLVVTLFSKVWRSEYGRRE